MNDQATGGTRAFRLLGLVPLAIYLVHFHYNWSQGNPGHGLWMCHVSNAVLGLGLLLYIRPMIRLAAIWFVPAIPLWIMDMMRTGQMPAITFVSHLGGLTVSLIALRRVRADRYIWLYGMAVYLLVQQVCRMVTPPELNVNVAHAMYPGWDRLFSAYWQYWIYTTLSAAAVLWVVNGVFMKMIPPWPCATAGATTDRSDSCAGT